MGTETIISIILNVFAVVVTVKLNNPLMGTETLQSIIDMYCCHRDG